MFQKNVPLHHHSNYKIGGPAQYFFEADTVKSLTSAVIKARKLKLPVLILGGGTNLLISSKGFNGLVLKPAFKKITHSKTGYTVTVGAGVLMSELLETLAKKGLTGLEWAGGLPGTVGGAVWGNAGAFGGEMKDSVASVTSVDISGKEPKTIKRSNTECDFAYRNSIFKKRALAGKPEVIVEITFALKKGDKKKISAVIEANKDYRRRKQPLDYPNVGSIFKNIDVKRVPAKTLKQFKHKIKLDPFPVLPTAVLIDAAGLRGVSFGGAMISQKHPNFIVNAMMATDADVKALMKLVKVTLKKKFGVEPEQEVIFWE